MKKTMVGVCVAVCMLAALLALTACYISRPDTVENVEGTYKLVEFTHVTPAQNEAEQDDVEARTTDYIKTQGVEAYLVVKSDGVGYYVYKDNQKPLFAREVKITFTYDEDNKDQVKEIKYYWDSTVSGDEYPNKGKETLGVNFTKNLKQLTYYLPAWDGLLIKRDHSQQVRYERVSDATDLSYVSSKVGAVQAAEFRLANLDGVQVYNDGYYNENSPYSFYLIDVNAMTKKADVVYWDKADEQLKTLTNLNVTYTIQDEEEATVEGHTPIMSIRIGTETYEQYVYGEYAPSTFFKRIPAQDEEGQESFYYFNNYGRTKSMNEIAQELIEANTPAEEPEAEPEE